MKRRIAILIMGLFFVCYCFGQFVLLDKTVPFQNCESLGTGIFKKNTEGISVKVSGDNGENGIRLRYATL